MNEGKRNCPLCKGSDAVTYMRPNAWNNRHQIELKRCLSCGFVYSAESLTDYSHWTTKTDIEQRIKKQRLRLLSDEVVRKTGLRDGRVLDFGCGIGLFALCLKGKGFETFGIEASEFYLNKHQEYGIQSAARLEDLNVPKSTFDLIVMKDVLEHVDEPVELLGELLGYLKPSGYFYVRVPNVNAYRFNRSIDTRGHINHFSPKTLIRVLESQNMKRVDFVDLYDVSSKMGTLYHAIFWKTRHFLPMYHQISILFQKV